MLWLAAQFGASALGSLLGTGAQNKQIAAQNRATYAQNQRLITQAGQEASAAYAQMGALSSQATGQLAEADRLATIQRGEQAVQAAASGTTGSSVMAVQYDIQRQQEQQQAATAADLETQLLNLRNRANSAWSSAYNNLGSAVKGTSAASALFGAVTAGAMSAGGTYINQRLTRGSTK